MIENKEYIELFDLTLRYENTILLTDKLFQNYNIPEHSKLTFIMRRKSIDFNSPTIYDSPMSINNFKNKIEKSETNAMLEMINNNLLNLQDQMYMIKDEMKNIKNDIGDIQFHIDQIKTDIDSKKSEEIFPMLP